MKLPLLCYFPGEERDSFFETEIDSEEHVVTLRNMVYKELKLHGQDVQRSDLSLYQVDIPVDPGDDLRMRSLRWLHDQSQQAPLWHPAILDTLFPVSPSNKLLHILIADPSIMELLDTLDEPDPEYIMNVHKGLRKASADLSSGNSPSEVVKTAEGVNSFLDPDKGRVYIDRVPVAMFSPPLAMFQQRLNDLDKIEVLPDEVECAAEHLGMATSFFDSEDQRQAKIRDEIDFMVGQVGFWQKKLRWAGGITPSASWWHWHREFPTFPTILLGLKNTAGLKGDAILQATANYSKIIAQKRFRSRCNFPVLLIGLTGNRIQISAAVCAGTIYVSSMCTLDLSSGFHASQKAVRLARVFKAISSSRSELKTYYDGVLSSPKFGAGSKLSALYPSPTFLSDARPPSLVYRRFMTRSGEPASGLPKLGNTMTAMYIATLSDTDQEVLVKFTARYNKEAHILLADAGSAPKLYFCERIVGDLYMVVMERVVECRTVWQLYKGYQAIPSAVVDQVERAVNHLHANGIVFGDLRDNNILYTQMDGSAGGKVFLVDFDWADKDGEGKYPATLNEGSLWEPSVKAYGIMRKAHDTWQVDRLRRQCAPTCP